MFPDDLEKIYLNNNYFTLFHFFKVTKEENLEV